MPTSMNSVQIYFKGLQLEGLTEHEKKERNVFHGLHQPLGTEFKHRRAHQTHHCPLLKHVERSLWPGWEEILLING